MAITLLVPTALRSFTDRKSEVEVKGDTVAEVIASLADTYPDLKPHLYEEDGSLRSYINLYVGDKNIKSLQGVGTAVRDGDTVMLVPAIAGGSV